MCTCAMHHCQFGQQRPACLFTAAISGYWSCSGRLLNTALPCNTQVFSVVCAHGTKRLRPTTPLPCDSQLVRRADRKAMPLMNVGCGMGSNVLPCHRRCNRNRIGTPDISAGGLCLTRPIPSSASYTKYYALGHPRENLPLHPAAARTNWM